jgi:hypothetical protein
LFFMLSQRQRAILSVASVQRGRPDPAHGNEVWSSALKKRGAGAFHGAFPLLFTMVAAAAALARPVVEAAAPLGAPARAAARPAAASSAGNR